jgi:hypothetical protein
VPSPVEAHVTHVDHLGDVDPRFVAARVPAESGAHACDKLAQPERLRDVVVGAHLEADDGVDLGVARRDHDDRHLRTGPQLAAHVDARDLGEHHVEQHERRAGGVEALDGLGAVGGQLHVEALALERDGERVTVGLLVVDDQDRRRIGHQDASLTSGLVSGLASGLVPGLASGSSHAGRLAIGSRNRKVEPSPSRDSTVTSPP